MGQTIEFKKFGNDGTENPTGTIQDASNQNFNNDQTTQGVNLDNRDDGDSMGEPMSALPAVTSVQKITATPAPVPAPAEGEKQPAGIAKPKAGKLNMKQALNVMIN